MASCGEAKGGPAGNCSSELGTGTPFSSALAHVKTSVVRTPSTARLSVLCSNFIPPPLLYVCAEGCLNAPPLQEASRLFVFFVFFILETVMAAYRSVAVFCGSRLGVQPTFRRAAEELW